jgi:glycosyltransferase involved in cell wall biosynthesis
MRLLVIDHNAVDPLQRKLYDLLAESPGVELMLVLPDRWHDNYLFLDANKGATNAAYETVQLKAHFTTRHHRMWYEGLGALVKRFQPQIIYINAEPENFQTWQAARCAQRCGAKLLFSSWRNIDHVSTGYPYKLSTLHRRIERGVLARAAGGHAFTPTTKEIFRKNGFGKMRVIAPFVDMTYFAPAEPAGSAEELSRPFTIGYSGRYIHEKGIDILLTAAKLLTFDFRIVFIGAGPEEAALRQQAAELGIAEKIEWLPPAVHSEMPKSYRKMDVLVLPSRTGRFWKEQFGRSLIEAMACGVPVIGSDSGGIPNVIGGTGLIFPEGDSGELAERISRLHGDEKLRKQCIARGSTRVRDNFSLKLAARAMLSWVNDVAKQ